MKRFKALVSCIIVVISMVALAVCLAGCTSKQTYTPPKATPELSVPTISTDGVLRVGVNIANPPLAGQPAGSSKIVGLDVDIAAALADSFGLKLEVIDMGADFESALAEGKVDLVMGVDKAAAPDSFWTSNVYLPTAVALFSTPGNTSVPAAGSQVKIAAQISSKSAWAVTNEFDQEALITTQDLEGAFSTLDSKQVSYVAADAIIGTYAAHKAGKETIIVALMQQPSGYAVGIADSNATLKQAVSDALVVLQSDGIISVIESKWLGVALNFSEIALTEGAKATLANAPADNTHASAAGTAGNAGNATSQAGNANNASRNTENTAGASAVQHQKV